MNGNFSKEGYWSDAWIKHIEAYLAAPPRAGHWMRCMFPKSYRVLEIAGGSCRDSRYLADKSYDAVGTDFDQKTLDYLNDRYPKSPLAMQREDAFSLSFANKSFDLSFSNGFWVCFSNDEEIYQLIHEQSRVTSRYLVALVHNAGNAALVASFKDLAKADPLYDIRFFSVDELVDIVNKSGVKHRAIRFYKFGGSMDAIYRKKIKRLPNMLSGYGQYIAPRMYQYQSWEKTERIACVLEL
jgi:ubiquinone/menaquinone biosynthesis C-methylase UbiE